MKVFVTFFVLLFCLANYAQQLIGNELLEKTIQYHDPNNVWNGFNGSLQITMEIPDKPKRVTNLAINLPEEYFYAKASRAGNTTEFILKKDSCTVKFNGKEKFTPEEITKNGLSCERAKMYKNYYSYLYGLPMKLKDAGTIIDPKVTRKSLKGKEYLVLKVTYDKEVGNDVWFFYINPKTYAMEAYQFYHTKKGSNQIDFNSGEYILLSEIKEVEGIKMPKIRTWFTNKEDKLLGTDILQ